MEGWRMHDELYSTSIQCPYCWEYIEISVDDCGENQQYIEDCQVCCQPINVVIERDMNEELTVKVSRDDE